MWIIYEFKRVQVNPLVLLDDLRRILVKVKHDMRTGPHYDLPEGSYKYILAYYSIMHIALIVMDDFLSIIITILFKQKSLQIDLYKVHSLPAIHLELEIQFLYIIEGHYFAASKQGLYVALPTEHDIYICKATQGYLSMTNQVLYIMELCLCSFHFLIENTSISIVYWMDSTGMPTMQYMWMDGCGL